MTRRHLRRKAVLTCAVLTCAALPTFTLVTTEGAHAATVEKPQPTMDVDRIEAAAARDIATSLSSPAWRTHVREAALTSTSVSLRSLTSSTKAKAAERLRPSVAQADRRLADAKGLKANTGALLTLRLGDKSMRSDLKAGDKPLVTTAPSNDRVKTVTAYDSEGRAHKLDTRRVPDRPVYVVDTDATKAVSAGMKILREELTRRGLPTPQATTAPKDGKGFWTTRVASIRLSDVKEPWIKGDAEIYSLVTGFDKEGKARVDPVDMPYLNEGQRTYHPNQILVNWSQYKYNLADVVLMEEDGGTNYRGLAKIIAGALLTIADGGAYTPLVNQLLDAIPDSWWTDDADYIDSFYTLAKGKRSALSGAGGNASMTIEPYFVKGL